MDGRLMMEQDAQRLSQTMAIYQSDGLRTGADYFHAAMVLQHGGKTEDYLLAHEFCMASIALGYEHARWLSAASYDRLLKSLGRPQRFGTQYGSQQPGGPMKLHDTEDGVRDSLRSVLNVQSLAISKAKEATMTKLFNRPYDPILSLGAFTPGHAPPGFDILDLNAGDMAPEATNQPAADYPESLLSEKLSGYAIVTCIIDRNGSASQIKIANATHPAFGVSAESALRKWTFKPAIKQGQPARVIVFVQFFFQPPSMSQ